ncbi:DUF1002 domain-containing protein [Caloranaerobacter ferrireducens]|uniref:DUF1002 domain-containing protein n=1 Tax=Caloranaerobacter ferrireducens TaxID=1323370 RepID=UPI000AF0F499|nr:DUF1002 domain-containing protein [Caloranaerobacter ferrireducens]
MIIKRFIVIVLFLVFISSAAHTQDFDVVVSIGEDLTEKQKNEILELFNVKDNVKIIKVTNSEERKYLGKYIDEKLIGTKAISSAYVKKLSNNEGISVETYNITWVSKEMYMNALVTAGIKDAKVKVAAPYEVSGTAALTGIIKAFENATGNKIGEREKEVANEEIAKTGELGQKIGKKQASQLIKEIKEEVVAKDLKEEDKIRKIVIKVSNELNIKLEKEEIDEIVKLMKDISELNLNLKEIKKQLKGISDKLNELSKENQEIKSLLERILEFLRKLFSDILTKLNNILQPVNKIKYL